MRDPGRNTWTFYEPAADGADLLPPAPFDALADPSVEDLLPAGLSLWPRGAAWGTPDGQAAGTDTMLAGFTRALLAPFADLYRRAWLLTQESRALTLQDSLEDWEADFGLPDSCSPDPAVAARRRALLTRVRSQATITPQDFIQLARQEGFDIAIEEPAVFECGFSECGGGHTVGDSLQEVYWIVHVYGLAVDYFTCGESECGHDPLFAVADVDRLQCLFARLAPGWTQPLYSIYEAQPETDALVARMAVPPSAERKKLIDDLILELKSWGIWQKLDLLYILAAHDAQAARLNWVPWTGVVTNYVRNNSGQGAVPGLPGTLPTNWVGASGIGLTRAVVAVGTEGGIDYVDIRWSGTPTATGAIPVTRFDADTAVPVAAGQVWTQSLYYTLAAGSLDGVATPLLRLREMNASSTTVAGVTSPLTIAPRDLGSSRQSYTYTVSNAAAAYLIFDLTINVTIGVPIDITLRIGLPQMVRMDVPGDPIRTTGAAASETQTLQRFDLIPAGAPVFVADQGYAGAANAWLASRYNPAFDGVHYTRDSAHIGAWSLTNRAGVSMIPGGVSMNTSLQCGLMARSAGDLAWINVNDQGGPLGAVTRSDGLTLGSRLDAVTRSNYRDNLLLGTASAASIAVPSVPLDLLCWGVNGGASRLYWCTDRIAVFTMGAGLSAEEVTALHSALHAYLTALDALPT